MYITTDNLIIKPLEKYDLEKFQLVYPNFYAFQQSIPLVSINNPLHVSDKLDICIEKHKEIGFGIGIATNKNNDFIGVAGYSFIEEVNTFEINYEILPEHIRKGYETEICNSLIDYAFYVLGLDKICARSIIGNFNKDRTYINAGFTLLGERAFELDGNIYLWNYYELENEQGLTTEALSDFENEDIF